jgi:hypothetical protein
MIRDCFKEAKTLLQDIDSSPERPDPFPVFDIGIDGINSIAIDGLASGGNGRGFAASGLQLPYSIPICSYPHHAFRVLSDSPYSHFGDRVESYKPVMADLEYPRIVSHEHLAVRFGKNGETLR